MSAYDSPSPAIKKTRRPRRKKNEITDAERHFRCETCDKGYTQQGALDTHIKNAHSEDSIVKTKNVKTVKNRDRSLTLSNNSKIRLSKLLQSGVPLCIQKCGQLDDCSFGFSIQSEEFVCRFTYDSTLCYMKILPSSIENIRIIYYDHLSELNIKLNGFPLFFEIGSTLSNILSTDTLTFDVKNTDAFSLFEAILLSRQDLKEKIVFSKYNF